MLKLFLRRSSTKDAKPTVTKPAAAGELAQGELWLNNNHDSPALFARADDDTLIEFNPAKDASETVKGIVELATAAETTAGTDGTRAVHPAGLKVELDKKANLASPALTGAPTAPTAAAGTDTTQLATTAFVNTANLWSRSGTNLSPKTSGNGVVLQNLASDGLRLSDGLFSDPASRKGYLTFNTSNQLQLNAVNADLSIQAKSEIHFITSLVEAGRIDAAGRLDWQKAIRTPAGVSVIPAGATFTNMGSAGAVLVGDGINGSVLQITRTASAPLAAGRLDGTGPIIELYNGAALATTIGHIGTTDFGVQNVSGKFGYAGSATTQMRFHGNNPGAPFAFFDGGYHNIANVTPAGAWTPASDRKLKTNIGPLSYGLKEIKLLEPKSYHFKTVLADNPTAEKNLGLIAQEVREVIPQVVHESIDGVLGIGYSELIPVLINAIKELSGQVDQLTQRVASLEAKNP